MAIGEGRRCVNGKPVPVSEMLPERLAKNLIILYNQDAPLMRHADTSLLLL
jgi:hypothetical protein